jgi:HlyD family secretion protein
MLEPIRTAIGTIQRAGTALPAPATLQRDAPLMHELRRPIRAGVLVVGLFFGGLGWWAATAPLAGAAIAPGIVSPEGSRRTVQHLEGGIIREILVDDGSVVQAGDPLIVLEDVQARAGFDVLQARFHTLAATQARLLAEQGAAASVVFPDWLVRAAADDATALEAMVAQRAMFDARAQALEDRKAILRRRIEQLREEIAGLLAQIRADSRQVELIDEEIAGVEQLYRKGLERKARLLALERTRADIEGNRAERRARIARAEQAIGEAELQIIAQDTAMLEAANEEASRVQAELAEIEQRLVASRDVLERTLITAPTAGTVVALRFRTRGGVIRPGEPILEVVPREEELLVDARASCRSTSTSCAPGCRRGSSCRRSSSATCPGSRAGCVGSRPMPSPTPRAGSASSRSRSRSTLRSSPRSRPRCASRRACRPKSTSRPASARSSTIC